jgi:hypothetical protein
MKKMKYVIYDHGGVEVPIIFPELVDHSAFSSFKPVSAGFANMYGDDKPVEGASCCENALRVTVWGKSVGLGVGSRKKDEHILLKELTRHYN